MLDAVDIICRAELDAMRTAKGESVCGSENRGGPCSGGRDTCDGSWCRPTPGAFGPGFIYNPAVFGNSSQRRGGSA